jgi:transketolase
MMRVLPNMTVLSPCDATQAKLAAVAAILELKGPVYLRFGREAMPDFTTESMPFEIGKAQLLRPGNDLTIAATGHLVWEALLAADELQRHGISVRVLNIHTIKPIDEEAIVSAAYETGAIITAEEHQVAGGLGGAVAEVAARHCPVPMEFIGMNDSFGESGPADALMEKYGMKAPLILTTALHIFDRKVKIGSHEHKKNPPSPGCSPPDR